mgnify:CR=1 FL=1|tara:strand:+ start:931 stop:1170 length:240 start_codon:yes stop_codon:yes gene_type:complete
MEGLINKCLELLRREDIRGEIKKALAPVAGIAAEQLYPYVQVCVLLVLGTFMLQAATFIIVFRSRKGFSAPKTFSSANV